jgi:hypothetical protein
MSDAQTSVPVVPRKRKTTAPVVIYDEDGPIVVVTKGGRFY